MKISFIFPGQGSQAPGMGKSLFEAYGCARETFEEASESIKFDLKNLCFNGSVEDLALTENTQPAILAVSTAAARVFAHEFKVTASFAAGHSIGEYAAVVAGGALNFSDAVRAVRTRGQAMQAAVPVGEGGMIAVMGLDEKQILALCEYAQNGSGEKPVEPANYNSPGQIVISGKQSALEWLKNNFKPELLPGEPKRAKLIPLQVSAPFHCSMMKPAEVRMSQVLGETKFTSSQFPIVQNYTAKEEVIGNNLKANLISQVSGPVRWIECVNRMKELGTSHFIELGHGKVASGLVKKIYPESTLLNLGTPEDLKAIEPLLKGSL